MKVVKKFPQKFTRVIPIIVLVLAIPLFIWGLIKFNLDIRNRAASGEPVPGACNTVCSTSIHPPITCNGGLTCYYPQVNQNGYLVSVPGAPGVCRNPNCSVNPDCSCATPIPTPRPSPYITCTSNNNCPRGSVCLQRSCETGSNCVSQGICVPKPTPTPTVQPIVCAPQNKIITVTPNGGCHDIQTAINAVSGDGYTVQIEPGNYNVLDTIHVSGKNTLTITGDSQTNNKAVTINFTAGHGWGFLIENSSGSLQWLTLQGGSSNGMLSIHNSNNFSVGYLNANSQNSHTMDIQGSTNISVYNTDIQSSAGALEIQNSSNVKVANDVIHNAQTGFSIYSSQNIEVFATLFSTNDDEGARMQDITNLNFYHNTLYNNAKDGHIPAISLNGIISNAAFSNNLVASNHGAGISFSGTSISATYSKNDVWSNLDGNYVNIPNLTGTNGNISADPLFGMNNGTLCLQNGSPAIYGNIANNEFMGYSAAICPTSGTGKQTMSFLINFGGVTDETGLADGAKVNVRFHSNDDQVNLRVPEPLTAHWDSANKAYAVNFEFTKDFLPSDKLYSIYIKGEKHLNTRYCMTGQTANCMDASGEIVVHAPTSTGNPTIYSFNKYPLIPGDLPPQDNVADNHDYDKIKALQNTACDAQTDTDKATADLNYDGCVDVTDVLLMRTTLETRYDEN